MSFLICFHLSRHKKNYHTFVLSKETNVSTKDEEEEEKEAS